MKHQFNIISLQEAFSTNLLMQEWEKAGKIKHGDVLRAVNQKDGIGQSGNLWESEAGKNLTFSLFLHTHFLVATEVFQLNKIISLAVCDYLIAKKIKNVKIKWPNDIYVGNKKIAGMLSHNSFLGDKLEFSIIGLGLNVNQIDFRSNAPNPISLKQITQIDYNLEEEFDKLLHNIEARLILLLNNDYAKLHSDYMKHLYGFDEIRKFKDAEGFFNGIIKGVDFYGFLLVEKENHIVSTYDVKTIEYL